MRGAEGHEEISQIAPSDFKLAEKGGGGGNTDLESRVAKLESYTEELEFLRQVYEQQPKKAAKDLCAAVDISETSASANGAVSGLRAISHDPTLRQMVTLTDGRKLTAIQLQLEYLDLARKYVEDRLGSDADPQTLDVLARWESVLDRLERDPMLCATELDWVAKLKLLEQYRSRDGLDWDDAKLHLIDLQYSDIRPEKGLYHRLLAGGRMERLLDEPSIEVAMHDPPEDTRAYFRGRCLEKYAEHVAAASVGLRDLRPAGPRVPAAGADDRPAARQQGPRRRPAGQM